jgi:hypothetical protein
VVCKFTYNQQDVGRYASILNLDILMTEFSYLVNQYNQYVYGYVGHVESNIWSIQSSL